MGKQYPPTPEIDAMIRRNYDERLRANSRGGKPTLAMIAAAVGWTRKAVWDRAVELGLVRTKEAPEWSPAELRILETFSHLTPARIALRLRGAGFERTVSAVTRKRDRLKLVGTGEFYSANQLASAMGVDVHAVMKWIRFGWLRAERRGTEHPFADPWLIRDSYVREFVRIHPAEFDIRRVDQIWFLGVVFGESLCVADGKRAG